MLWSGNYVVNILINSTPLPCHASFVFLQLVSCFISWYEKMILEMWRQEGCQEKGQFQTDRETENKLQKQWIVKGQLSGPQVKQTKEVQMADSMEVAKVRTRSLKRSLSSFPSWIYQFPFRQHFWCLHF